MRGNYQNGPSPGNGSRRTTLTFYRKRQNNASESNVESGSSVKIQESNSQNSQPRENNSNLPVYTNDLASTAKKEHTQNPNSDLMDIRKQDQAVKQKNRKKNRQNKRKLSPEFSVQEVNNDVKKEENVSTDLTTTANDSPSIAEQPTSDKSTGEKASDHKNSTEKMENGSSAKKSKQINQLKKQEKKAKKKERKGMNQEDSTSTDVVTEGSIETEPKAREINTDSKKDVEDVCKRLEDLQIKLAPADQHERKETLPSSNQANNKHSKERMVALLIKKKNRRPKKEKKLMKPALNRRPPQMKDISSEDVLPSQKSSRVLETVLNLWRSCALQEDNPEEEKKKSRKVAANQEEPMNFLQDAIHYHPSDDFSLVNGMIVKNKDGRVVVRLEGQLSELESELRYLQLNSHSTAQIKCSDGSLIDSNVPLDQLLLGSRIVVHEIGYRHGPKTNSHKTAKQLFDAPIFYVKKFSPYALLHEEIGLCVFSRQEITERDSEDKPVNGWVEGELVSPSLRRPFRFNTLNCNVKNWLKEEWANWGHNFVNLTLWRLPLIKTQTLEKDRVITISDQDTLELDKLDGTLMDVLEKDPGRPINSLQLTYNLSLVGVRLVEENEFDLIESNYKIPLENIRQQELYIRDVYLSLNLLEEVENSREIRKRTVDLTVSGRTYFDMYEKRKIALIHVRLSRELHKRLFLESSTASWDKSQTLVINLRDQPDVTLHGYVVRDPHNEVPVDFEIELETRSLNLWKKILTENPNPEVTIGPWHRRHDFSCENLYKQFAMLRNTKMHGRWLKCEGVRVDSEKHTIPEKFNDAIQLDASQHAACEFAFNRLGFSTIAAATGTGKTLVSVALLKRFIEQENGPEFKPLVVCAQNNSGIDRIQAELEKLLPDATVVRLISDAREAEYPCHISLTRMCRRALKYLSLTEDVENKHLAQDRNFIGALENPKLKNALNDVNLRIILGDANLHGILANEELRKTINNETVKLALENQNVLDALANPALKKILCYPPLRTILADWDLVQAVIDPNIRALIAVTAMSEAFEKYNEVLEQLKNPSVGDGEVEKLAKLEEKTDNEMKTMFLTTYKPQIIITTIDMLARQSLESEKVIVEEGGQFSSSSMLMLLDYMKNLKQVILVGDHRLIGPFNVFRFGSQAKTLRGISEMERIAGGSRSSMMSLEYSYRAHPKLVRGLLNLRYPELKPVRNTDLYDQAKIPRSSKKDPFGFIAYTSFNQNPTIKDQCRIDIVDNLLKKLKNGGVETKDIVILCFLRAHCRELNRALKGKGVEVFTVDSYQGREHPVVIVLGAVAKNLEFSDDIKRLTVVISRAREALYIIGLKQLFELPNWKPFYDLAESRGAFLSPTTFEASTPVTKVSTVVNQNHCCP